MNERNISEIDLNQTVYDIHAIMGMLPHRYPFCW